MLIGSSNSEIFLTMDITIVISSNLHFKAGLGAFDFRVGTDGGGEASKLCPWTGSVPIELTWVTRSTSRTPKSNAPTVRVEIERTQCLHLKTFAVGVFISTVPYLIYRETTALICLSRVHKSRELDYRPDTNTSHALPTPTSIFSRRFTTFVQSDTCTLLPMAWVGFTDAASRVAWRQDDAAPSHVDAARGALWWTQWRH